MDHFAWWAVRNVSVDEMAARLVESGWFCDPTWRAVDTFYGPPEDADECTLVQFGNVTVVCVANDDPRLDEVYARFPTTWKLHQTETWAEISERRSGVQAWHVMGDEDSDYVHSEGAVPRELGDIISREDDLLAVAADAGERLLGICFRDYEIVPTPTRVVHFTRTPPEIELDVGEGRTFTVEPTTNEMSTLVARPPHTLVTFDVVARTTTRLLVLHYGADLYSISTADDPPRFTRLSHANADGATFTPWGTTLIALVDDSINSFLVDDGTLGPALPFPAVASLHDVGVGVLVVPRDEEGGDLRPVLLQRSAPGAYRLLALDVPARDEEDDQGCLAAAFGDGTFLLHWLGQTYRGRLVGDSVEVTELEALEIEKFAFDGAVAQGPDSSLYIGTSTGIVQLWSDGRRVEFDGFRDPCRISRATNDMYLVVDHDEQAVVKLWWPARDRMHSIENCDDDRFLLTPATIAYYDATRDRVVVMDDKQVRTVSLASGLGPYR